MKRLINPPESKRTCFLGIALAISVLLTGCDEVNLAINTVLGIETPMLSSNPAGSSLSVVPARNLTAGDAYPSRLLAQAAPPGKPSPRPETGTAMPSGVEGKKRSPGYLPPGAARKADEAKPAEPFTMERDPFEQPTEILPSECPPSMPLCRFDRSQLKLVGVIQVSAGQFKGLVEDPDGRGYFISTGMQIGGGTVTQVTTKGITLHMHKTNQDVQLPLFSSAREAEY
jgi:hypothetical protein